MTSRERVEAALRHREPDRTPMFEYVILSPMAGALLGRRYVTYHDLGEWFSAEDEYGWEEALKRSVTDLLDLSELLGHDMLYVMPAPQPNCNRDMPACSPPMLGAPIERVRNRNETASQHPVGLSDESLVVYEILREEMSRRGLDLPILAPAYMHGIWNDVDLMQTMVLAPEVAHEHFTLATRNGLTRVDQCLKAGADLIGVGGDFAGNRPMISPEMYREFIVPGVRALSGKVHSAGRWAINASDGNLWSVIDDFLIGCDVDGYLEIDQHAGMDLSALKKRFGDRITLLGNMDCGLTLSTCAPEEIRRRTVDCIEAGSGGGGHILCAGSAITGSIPLVNYLAMVDAYREVFGIPALRLG